LGSRNLACVAYELDVMLPRDIRLYEAAERIATVSHFEAETQSINAVNYLPSDLTGCAPIPSEDAVIPAGTFLVAELCRASMRVRLKVAT
jgi:hypothetical protein